MVKLSRVLRSPTSSSNSHMFVDGSTASIHISWVSHHFIASWIDLHPSSLHPTSRQLSTWHQKPHVRMTQTLVNYLTPRCPLVHTDTCREIDLSKATFKSEFDLSYNPKEAEKRRKVFGPKHNSTLLTNYSIYSCGVGQKPRKRTLYTNTLPSIL